MRVVFFGTPEVAAVALQALLASHHEVIAVVTQPDRPSGRGRAPQASPVKATAERAGILVLQPEDPKQESFAEQLRALRPDSLAVVAYGHILAEHVLAIAPAVNAHFSLLPAYRGAAPVQRALMAGETETGVTVFRLEPSVDSGPILRTATVQINEADDAGSLLDKLAPIAADTLIDALDAVAAGEPGHPQDASKASPAPKIKPSDQVIDWSEPARAIVGRVRGLSPKPGAYTTYRGKRLLVRRASLADAPTDARTPGAIDGTVVSAGEGAVELLEVQPEGKRRMTGEEFVRGYRPGTGTILGE
ncbi:MAG: methionyl-tRNA formyltransferase [Actinomycetota bacterium]